MADITEGEAGTIERQEYQTAIRCLICGKEVITSDHYLHPIVCDECKEAVELIKVLYRHNGHLWDSKDPR